MLHFGYFLFSFITTFSQANGWELLGSVEIVKGYDSFMGAEIDQPKFSDDLFAMEGKAITLDGFMIPLQEQGGDGSFFILSRFPYQSCFFCGGAGPETVVEVYTISDFDYTEDPIKVIGKLKLNANNPLQLFYILDDSRIVN